MRFVCIADTHGRHRALDVPEGDVLLHAGDVTMWGKRRELVDFNAWMAALPHRHKVVIAGNHDWIFEREPREARRLLDSAIYLEDSGMRIGRFRIWGTPWHPKFAHWAFALPRGEAIAKKWSLIPPKTDILITHTPPFGTLDRVGGILASAVNLMMRGTLHAGCEELRRAAGRIRPAAHLFGHIHEAYGAADSDGTRFINASTVNAGYRPVNAPIVLDL